MMRINHISKVYKSSPLGLIPEMRLWNSGGLPEGITFEQFLGPHSSCPRNRLIARVFYLAGFIESWGRGIGKIRREFLENGLQAPIYKEEMGGMSVYIPRRKGLFGRNDGVNDGVKITKNEKAILRLMMKNDLVTYVELQKKLHISESTVRRAIKKLSENVFIVREGSDKTGHWYVTDKGKELL